MRRQLTDQQKWLEAKQFPLALLEANRVDDALQITVLLKEEYQIINVEVIKRLLQYYPKSQLEQYHLIHPYLYLPFCVSFKQTSNSSCLYSSFRHSETRPKLYLIKPILSKFSSRITHTKAILRIA